MRNKKDALLTVCALAFTYVFTSALIVFQVEPQIFGNLFNAIYWENN
jgi:voltage-gated potassium channel